MNPNIKIIEITQDVSSHPEVIKSEFLQEISRSTFEISRRDFDGNHWGGYFAESVGRIVGTCAFKGAPQDGAVEIAYFTFDEFEGRGIATAMAAHLIDVAKSRGIKVVIAQTLPGHGASTKILQKLGFAFTSSIQHPEDGTVWEWRKPLD